MLTLISDGNILLYLHSYILYSSFQSVGIDKGSIPDLTKVSIFKYYILFLW